MDELFDVDVLPSEVLCQILWSNHLDLFDTLRCLEVWMQLLQSVPTDLQRKHLAKELVMLATADHQVQQTALRLQAGIPELQVLCTIGADPPLSYTACWNWLSLKAGFLGHVV